VICELLGVPYDDLEFFLERSVTVQSSLSTQEESQAAGKEMFEYLIALVAKKAAAPDGGSDLISRVLREHVATGELTAEELADMARILMVAGHETTASQIALGVLALCEHPAALERLRSASSEVEVVEVIQELLRYLTIVQHGIGRVALEDVTLDGTTIRAGEGVLVALGAANRDPAVFAAPDVLDVGRGDVRQHIAFGAGIHRCTGAPLAELELEIAYTSLWRRLPDLRLAVPLDQLEFKHDKNNYGPVSVPVTW